MAISGRATMDFFESQAAARRRTAFLVFLFLLAVLLTMAGVYGAVVVAWNSVEKASPGWWHPRLFFSVIAFVTVIILGGTIYKIFDLRKGGPRVAELLGGVPVVPNTADPDERRLLNVVQEMAIASGLPVPGVYLLPRESGINAFAAGFAPQDAVVAVTRGALETLSRDQLQGVVAHEFSHILNGDMRLNIKLMGTIHGLLLLALIGRRILSSDDGGNRGVRIKSRGKGSGGIFLFAFLLMVVGYIGVFFGSLIRSAVSRQREFLADAAAVQFTRNPAGLAGALKKIARRPGGSLIGNPRAEAASHLFFVDALKDTFLRFFKSHPPLRERIRRIETVYPEVREAEKVAEIAEREKEKAVFEESLLSEAGIQALADSVHLDPRKFLDSVGNTQSFHVGHAQKMLADLPAPVAEATRDPLGAQALIFCLLLCEEEQDRDGTKEEEFAPGRAANREIARLRPFVAALGREHLLPLLDMAWPALKNLSNAQYREFRAGLQRLIDADRKIDLFEFTVRSLLTNRLDTLFGLTEPRRIRYRSLGQVQMELFELLSILSRRGNRSDREAGNAFQKAMEILFPGRSFSILAREKCSLSLLDRALSRLAETSFDLRRKILNACLLCIGADRRITVGEAELLRAIAEHLDCPIPPIRPGTLYAE